MTGKEQLGELSQADYCALAQFRYLIRRFLHFSEEAARAEGLEPQQHQMLLAIQAKSDSENGGHFPSVGQLAEALFIRHHSAVGLADRLEERGLAKRVRGDVNRREVQVRLTPEGAQKLKRLSNAHHAELRNSGPLLVESLAALLHR